MCISQQRFCIPIYYKCGRREHVFSLNNADPLFDSFVGLNFECILHPFPTNWLYEDTPVTLSCPILSLICSVECVNY